MPSGLPGRTSGGLGSLAQSPRAKELRSARVMCYRLFSCSYPDDCPVGIPCTWAFPPALVGSQNPELLGDPCTG